MCTFYWFHDGKHFKGTDVGGRCSLENTADIHKNYLRTPPKDCQICMFGRSTLLSI